MANEPTLAPRVVLPSAPAQPLPSNVSIVVKESGVPVRIAGSRS